MWHRLRATYQLKRDDITVVIRSLQERTQRCADGWGVNGQAKIRMRIERTGTAVSQVDIRPRIGASDRVRDCVAAAVQNAQFERFNGPAMSIDAPIRLRDVTEPVTERRSADAS